VTLVGLQSIGTNSQQHPGPNIGIAVFQVVENLYEERIFDKPSSPHQLFDYVKPFFEAVLRFIKATKGRFAVEFLEGDITNVLEQAATPWICRGSRCILPKSIRSHSSQQYSVSIYVHKKHMRAY
jgi:hypothetical protein